MELCQRRVRGIFFILTGFVKPARREFQDAFLSRSEFGIVGVVGDVAVVHAKRHILVKERTALATPRPRNCTVLELLSEQNAVPSLGLDAVYWHVAIPVR